MMLLDLQALPQAFAGRVLNTIAEGIALTGVSWLALRIVKTQSAMTRFAVWFSTLLAIVLMPLLVRSGSFATTIKPHFHFASSWATYLFVAWAIVAGVFLIRLAGSLWHVRRLRRESRQVNEGLAATVFETLQPYAGGRKVNLLVSGEIRIPTALGFFRPAIVLPSWTLAQLSADELKVILLHELAHLRRRDDWTNLVQKLLKAIFFFHPAVWWIEEKLSLEREIACDDLVLEQTGSAKTYAASLISVAEKALSEKSRVQRTLALAQSALGRVRQTSKRIAEILNPSRRNQASSWRPATAVASGLMAVVLVATPYAPELISFKATTGAEVSRNSVAPAITPPTDVPAIRASARIPALSQEAVLAHRSHGSNGATAQPARMIPARSKMSASAKPKVILASSKTDQQPRFVLLVRSEQFGSAGSWTLCVWRVSSQADGSGRIEETIIMNSI